MNADLLFEIGCEEIPARMLARACAELPALVESKLAAARLAHAGVRALGTPRRLAVIVTALADHQPDVHEEVAGPPASAAFAADGSLTKAGQGFAAKHGVATLAEREVAGKKGRYAVAVRDVAGQPTRALLPALLGELAGAIAWPKSQRWGWGETAFVRPVQWLVALYGGEVVPLQWANLASGRTSRGHRFLSPGPIEIALPARYVETLRAAHVVVDPDARLELVRAELARLERATGLRVRRDDALLGEVVNLGEYPVGVAGEFDPAYLALPEDIVVTAMRTHQRYFAMEDASGKLANRFATLMATVVKDPVVVQKGNERVLAARLADAQFFVAEDKKLGFEAWNKKLASVVFQAKLGDAAKTIGHKITRLCEIAEQLAPRVGIDPPLARTAAALCKSDLASHAVGEFPELQGVMGRHYATQAGVDAAIATALDEHWWPKGQGGALPATPLGALLAVADRMDTIVGCFAAGLEPTGSADPLGLRRAAIGIWQILLARGAPPWPELFTAARDALAAQRVTVGDDAALAIARFFRARLHGILVDHGVPTQDADAALEQRFDDPSDALARARAVARIPAAAREVFKRVANILDDARKKGITPGLAPDAALFGHPAESNLHAAVAAARAQEAPARERRDYAALFDSLVALQPTVAAFFDKGGVMVMDKDARLRDNRLALLNWLVAPYMAIADFRKLGT